jgi:hypothetical protein
MEFHGVNTKTSELNNNNKYIMFISDKKYLQEVNNWYIRLQ